MVFHMISNLVGEALSSVVRVLKIEFNTPKTFSDPGTFLSGAVAGGIGRLAVLPIDAGGVKGVQQTVLRRVPQFGFLMMFYCPIAHKYLPGMQVSPVRKMWMTFLIGACAGFNMRLFCNPISRVADECRRTNSNPFDVIKQFRSKTILHFWYTGPGLFVNAVYFGTLFTVFEGLRRFTQRNILPIKRNAIEQIVVMENGHRQLVRRPNTQVGPSVVDKNWNTHNYLTTALTHFCIGGISAATACTLCYPLSANSYLQTVIHNSALCRGFMPTIAKQVPMVAITFGVFSLLQPLFAPRHGVRCGFGY